MTDHQATGSSKGGQRYLLDKSFQRHIAKNIVKGKVTSTEAGGSHYMRGVSVIDVVLCKTR